MLLIIVIMWCSGVG